MNLNSIIFDFIKCKNRFKLRWFKVLPHNNVVWTEVTFTPNILCLLICIVGITGAKIYSGEFNSHKEFKKWFEKWSKKSLDEIVEIIFLKILNVLVFLAMYITGGYTLSRLISHANYIGLGRIRENLKYLADCNTYLYKVNNDPAVTERQRKVIISEFEKDFEKEFEERFGKMIRFIGRLIKQRLSFWVLFDALPFLFRFLVTNFSFFEIFLANGDFSSLPLGCLILIISFLFGILFAQIRNIQRLLKFLLFGLLRNWRPYLLSYFIEALDFLVWIPHKQSVPNKYLTGDTRILFPNEDEKFPSLEKVDESYSKMEALESCTIKPKPLKDWNFEFILRIPDLKEIKPKVDARQLSIEETFNF